MNWEQWLVIAALIILLVAAIFDLVRMEIPDSLSILLLALAFVHWLASAGAPLWSRLAAMGIMLLLGLLLFQRGWMGGGDIKLLTAMAPWIGLHDLPILLLAVALAGGLLAFVMLALRFACSAAGIESAQLPMVLQKTAPLPYAVAIAIGAIFWFWRAHL